VLIRDTGCHCNTGFKLSFLPQDNVTLFTLLILGFTKSSSLVGVWLMWGRSTLGRLEEPGGKGYLC
jgi:hypothetical protein